MQYYKVIVRTPYTQNRYSFVSRSSTIGVSPKMIEIRMVRHANILMVLVPIYESNVNLDFA